jgi:oxygen-independent coproporphyrinogen-3 oxidase
LTPGLSLYVHWPYCTRICPYCDFAVVRDRGRAAEAEILGQAILADLSAQAQGIGPRRLVSVFFGGGTPSLMPPDLVADVIARARALFPPDGPVEVSLEANPSRAEAERFSALAAAGVGRLSLGVQSFDDADLVFLGRDHDAAAGAAALDLAAKTFPRVSIDLIYGLPGRDAPALERALKRAVGAGCEHVSAYELTIEPGTAFHRAVARGRFEPIDGDLGAELFDTKDRVLSALGFEAYEISNHARGPAARCRHNLTYWRGEEYLGVGPAAHGRIKTHAGWWATETARAPKDYAAKIRETGVGLSVRQLLSPLERAEERMLMGLRTLEGVALEELHPGHLEVAPGLEASGLLVRRNGRLQATLKGRLVLNAVVERLLL